MHLSPESKQERTSSQTQGEKCAGQPASLHQRAIPESQRNGGFDSDLEPFTLNKSHRGMIDE